jgi:hypothetical protein
VKAWINSALTPTPPLAIPLARVTIIARTTSLGTSVPWCVVWRLTRRAEKSSMFSMGIR